MQHTTREWRHRSGWSGDLPDWDGPGTVVLAFGDPSLSADAPCLADLRAAYPSSAVVGCSIAGQVHGPELRDIGLVVGFARFERVRVRVAVEALVPDEARSGGRRLMSRLLSLGDDLAGVFVLSEGVGVDGSELAAGLSEASPERVTISGGLAADGPRFEKTWTLVDGVPTPGFVTAVGFYGEQLRIRHGSRRGWQPLGPPRSVTSASGSTILTLDGIPALEVIETYLGRRAQELPAAGLLFPFSVRTADAQDREHIVVITGVDRDRASVTVSRRVEIGATAQLLHASSAHIVEAAGRAMADAQLPEGGPGLAVAVSCAGRRLALGEAVGDEIWSAASAMVDGTSLVGFYSYGELSATAPARCELLNQTMTVTVLGEC